MNNPTIIFEKPKTVILTNTELARPAQGQLLIRTRLSLISTGTELTILSGTFPPHSAWSAYGRFPFVAGYTNVGVVIEVGAGVDAKWIGRRVATMRPHAAWVMASTSEATIIPDEVPDEHAVFFSIAAIVMNGVRRSALAWGESAIVYGLGLLGQFAARFCEIAGARRVFAVDVAENRLAMLPRSPAIVPVNPSDTDIRALVRDHNHGRLVEVAFEVTGDPALIPGEFAALRRQGRMVILSSPRGPTPMFDFHNLSNAPSYTIIGAHVTSHPEIESPANQWTQIRHFDLFFDYLCETRIDVAPLISGIVPYAKAPETYAALLENRIPSMGIIFDWRG